MKESLSWLLVLCVAGCGAEVGEESEIDTVNQRLTNHTLERWQNTGASDVTVTCASTKPILLSGGGSVSLGEPVRLRPDTPSGSTTPNAYRSSSTDSSAGITAEAVCSDIPVTRRSQTSSDGDTTAKCQSGEEAIGGGVSCPDGGMYINRPWPNTAGGTATGWRGACRSGSVTAYVNCVSSSSVSCEVASATETSSGIARAWCPSGSNTPAVGAYCGSNGTIRAMDIANSFEFGNIVCSGARADAYAVCCTNLVR